MSAGRDQRQFNLITAHTLLWSLAMSMAGGFIGSYLLRLGFSLAETMLLYAGVLAARFVMRTATLPLVRRLGTHRAWLLGTVVSGCQYLALIYAGRPVGILAWGILVAAGDCLYWPLWHAASAASGSETDRGRQLAIRQIAGTVIAIAAPVAGGFVLTRIGPAAEFGVATAICILAVAPLLVLGKIDLGPVPGIRDSLGGADRFGLFVFMADGWIVAGTYLTWSLILFTSLGSGYEAYGWAGAAAGLAGAFTGLLSGVAVDRGHRGWAAWVVSGLMLLAIACKIGSGFVPEAMFGQAAFAANAVGALVAGIYIPLLATTVYDRAKRSGAPYRFHVAAEAGWDIGAILSCCTIAAIAFGGAAPTLMLVPSVLGVLAIHRLLNRAED